MPREEDEAKGSDSDDDLLACCNALEDLLLDDIMPADIYCGDQDSGEEGKGEELEPGQQLFVQVQTVCRKALPFFVDAVRDGLNVGEYLPEHQEFHEQYMGIIEDAMSKVRERKEVGGGGGGDICLWERNGGNFWGGGWNNRWRLDGGLPWRVKG